MSFHLPPPTRACLKKVLLGCGVIKFGCHCSKRPLHLAWSKCLHCFLCPHDCIAVCFLCDSHTNGLFTGCTIEACRLLGICVKSFCQTLHILYMETASVRTQLTLPWSLTSLREMCNSQRAGDPFLLVDWRKRHQIELEGLVYLLLLLVPPLPYYGNGSPLNMELLPLGSSQQNKCTKHDEKYKYAGIWLNDQ